MEKKGEAKMDEIQKYADNMLAKIKEIATLSSFSEFQKILTAHLPDLTCEHEKHDSAYSTAFHNVHLFIPDKNALDPNARISIGTMQNFAEKQTARKGIKPQHVPFAIARHTYNSFYNEFHEESSIHAAIKDAERSINNKNSSIRNESLTKLSYLRIIQTLIEEYMEDTYSKQYQKENPTLKNRKRRI